MSKINAAMDGPMPMVAATFASATAVASPLPVAANDVLDFAYCGSFTVAGTML